MKFLDVPALNEATQFLESLNTGDRRLRGRVEAYSCKIAGEDKKLYKELDARYEKQYRSPRKSSDAEEIGDESIGNDSSKLKRKRSSSIKKSRCNSDSSATGSLIDAGDPSIGSLANANTRRLLISLICTLNATFPDYDFKSLSPERIVRQNLGLVVNSVNSLLSELVEQSEGGNFLDRLWIAIDAEVQLSKCEVFSYVPDADDDPFSVSGSIWALNYFFYSQQERKVVFLTCCCLSVMQTATSHGDDLYGLPNVGTAEDEEDDVSESVSQGQDGDLLDYGLDDDGAADADEE